MGLEKWVGPFGNIWSDQECKVIESSKLWDNFKKCSKACEDNNDCDAINLKEDSNADCQLLKCPYTPHISIPTKTLGGYKGYCVRKETTEECKQVWTEDCHFL